MSPMNFFERHRRNAFARKASKLGTSGQFELYRCSKEILSEHLQDDLAGKVAAVISNYVFRYGDLKKDQVEDEELMHLMASHKSIVFERLDEIFKSNATGALILVAAAWQVDMETFKRHLSTLASEGFAKVGTDTPDVSRDLPQSDQVYVFWAAEIGRAD